jgi:hypothetical protein
MKTKPFRSGTLSSGTLSYKSIAVYCCLLAKLAISKELANNDLQKFQLCIGS